MAKKDDKKEKDAQHTDQAAFENQKDQQEFIPPLDFSSLVIPFFTQALIKLGQVEETPPDQEGKNIELVKRLIDLLDLLKDRTKGNLKPEEQKYLDACLHQLKLSYMEKARVIKL